MRKDTVGSGLILVLALAATLGAGVAQAATRFVSDELSINLRRGAGNEFRITELLEAGERVEVLDSSNGWSRVRTSGGKVGFVLSRFLSDSPSARDQVARYKREAGELKEENAALKKELSQALEGSSELGKLKKDLVRENKELKQKLARIKNASENAIRISEENQEFREQILSLESEVERLSHENKSLQSRREGMKIGAMVLVVGILIGLVLPLFRRRSRSSWDSL